MFKTFEEPNLYEKSKHECSRECQFAKICKNHPGASAGRDERRKIAVGIINKEDTDDYAYGDPERYDEYSRSSILEANPKKLEEEVHLIQEKEGYDKCFEIKKNEQRNENWN